MKIFKNGNWKKVVVAAAIFGAGAYAGPVGGKVAGFLVPKALEHVSDTPISDIKEHKNPLSKEAITHEPIPIVIHVVPAEKRMLADVAKDHGIDLKLHCVAGPSK